MMHQWMQIGGDSIVTKWICIRCESKIIIPNSEDEPLLPDNFYLGKKGIPLDCDEAICSSIIAE